MTISELISNGQVIGLLAGLWSGLGTKLSISLRLVQFSVGLNQWAANPSLSPCKS